MATLPPLTHHEILELCAPLSRAGRRVDLPACDRGARRVVFQTVERGGLRETLTLHNPYAGVFTLTRTLAPLASAEGRGAPSSHDQGPAAVLVAEGPSAAPLLGLVDGVAPERQFASGDGYAIAHQHQVTAGDDGPLLLLERSVVRAGGLSLTMTMPSKLGRAADIEITVADGDPIVLPEDLLAVLGWDFAPLSRVRGGAWISKLRLRGAALAKTRRAEGHAQRIGRHLATTLAEPPRRFHERHLAARWGALLRRIIPILTAVLLVSICAALPADYVRSRRLLVVLLMNAPLLVIGLSFTLQEMARIELPPLPRPSRAAAWRDTLVGDAQR